MATLKQFEGYTIWSGKNYKQLAEWYKEIFELKQVLEIDIPEDKAVAFEIDPNNESYLWIGFHSKVTGKNKDPYRLMISFIVDDVEKMYLKIKDKKVKVIAKPHISPDNKLNVLTLMDPENNLLQFFSEL